MLGAFLDEEEEDEEEDAAAEAEEYTVQYAKYMGLQVRLAFWFESKHRS